MIIEFSCLGIGSGRQTDLCGQCRYFLKIQYRDKPAQVAWLSGAQIEGRYGAEDVKITIHGLKRCKRHGGGLKTGNADRKPRRAFMEAAIRSGIDILEGVDDNRYDRRQRNVRI